MSTTTSTYRSVPADNAAPATAPAYAPRPVPGKKNTGWIVATITAASLALLGMIAALLLAFAPAQSPTPAPAANTAVVVHHKTTKHTTVTPAHHSTAPVTPVVTPSDSIKLEQQQLGDLNYYEGPVNGYYTQATIDAVKCLQRDAGLPQTGQMDSATQAAMTKMLINGNNQMAG